MNAQELTDCYERIDWLEKQREIECRQKEAALKESQGLIDELKALREAHGAAVIAQSAAVERAENAEREAAARLLQCQTQTAMDFAAIREWKADRDKLAFEKCSALAELGRACTKVTELESALALYKGLGEENRKFESIRNGDLVTALEELVSRCDGAEGVRADGSNIDTLRAHAALHEMPHDQGETRGQAVVGNDEGEVPNRAPATPATPHGSNTAPVGGEATCICPDFNSFGHEPGCPMLRREFNSVGHPTLPERPTLREVAKWLRDKGLWEQLQSFGRDMDAREWAASCLTAAAEDIETSALIP